MTSFSKLLVEAGLPEACKEISINIEASQTVFISVLRLEKMGEENGVGESRVQPLVGVHSRRHRLPKNAQLHQKTRRQLRRISAAAP